MSSKIKKSGSRIIVQDFLTNPDSYDLSSIKKDWWYISMFPTIDEKQHIRDLNLDNDFQEKKLFNLQHYNDGYFSYSFRRTLDDHYDTCVCTMCELKKLFNSEEMKTIFSDIVGETVTEMNEGFCSKYDSGDYLSVHHDKNKGDYAFVYQLTKDWNPSHGGILNFWNPETKELDSVFPEYNSLVIFKIKNLENTDHFVSMNTSNKSRYAYTGWFTC